MGRPQEVAELLGAGYSPNEIAQELDISPSSAKMYLYQAVGHGYIRRSDILFSIDQKTRDITEEYMERFHIKFWFDICNTAEQNGITLNPIEVRIYMELRDERVALGDMYEDIRQIETGLHKSLKKYLIKKFGESKKDWWRKGIPEPVRIELAKSYEDDEDPAGEAYCYTTLLDLDRILSYNWKDLLNELPKKVRADKKAISNKLVKLNRIRNYVMHPVKGIDPAEKDFLFVREFKNFLKLDKWP